MKHRRILYHDQSFTIVRSTSSLPGGKRVVNEYCRRPPSVIVIPLIDHRRVAMTVEHRKERGGYVWGAVAGHVERGELHNPKAAARRELREEAGYQAANMRLLWVSEPSSSVRWKRYVYLATGIKPLAQKTRHNEGIAINIITLDHAARLALAGKIPNETVALTLLRLNHEAARRRKPPKKSRHRKGRGSAANPRGR